MRQSLYASNHNGKGKQNLPCSDEYAGTKTFKKQNNDFPALLYLGCDNEDVAERLAHYEETHEGHTHGKNLVKWRKQTST